MEVEAEQERLEEECLQRELERMKKKAEAKKKVEEKTKKRGREDSVRVTVRSVVGEKGVVWYTKEGEHCHTNKKTCHVTRVGQDGLEAGPSKKRKVGVMKGKWKEKEKLELELGVDAVAMLRVEMRGVREEVGGVKDKIGGVREAVVGLCAEFCTLAKMLKSTNGDVGYIADMMQKMNEGQEVEGVEMEGVEMEVEGMEGNVRVGGSVSVEGLENEVEETLQ
ncbi:hypothetical protein PILCRDRAFT_83674 [Piloderma croceum F 1598]|uniref:Uncharacterized protein n=1 Tax=Piloderma croceum (strain F 1598) TaxID=765440 RepID=A0A0C3G568_PILCF|nr:hypothetical protein PILCRDRAFT_83674 [Piloderma croceum F 1598]